MPRATYGDDVKVRVKHLFTVLISLSDLNEDNCDISFKWHESGELHRKLVVKTTLRHLETLTKKDGSGHLTKTQIREALQRMHDFLGILSDNRLQKQGTENWDFTLKPWCTETAKNLEQFEIEWEKRRPPKSKQLAASSAAAVKAKNTEYKKSGFCQAPPLPQYFVERPKHQESVKNLLLAQSADARGTLVVSAIYGLGGIGKSTLAAALAHKLEVQTLFSDGILWVTLGQNPDLLPLLGNWIKTLEDYNYNPITVNDASMHLQTLLYYKKALLVIDDAWNPEHVEYFRVGGSNCRVLVTTREAVIKGATRYDLDVLTPEQSVELLQKSCGSLKLDEQHLAQDLAATVGYLPLALDLAASQVAEGVTWAELLEDLQTDIAYLETLNLPDLEKYTSEEKRKHYSLIASFNLSLRFLTPEMLGQFAWFGVLPEDVNITPAMAATLWSITPRQALTTLRFFKTKALLLPGINFDKQQQTYRLHDLMHDMAKRSLVSEPSPHQPHELPGLGLKLADAHSLLLERYQKKTTSGLWHTLSDDGYIYGNLSWHLEQAQKVEDLHQLLQQETETGRNGWYEACERLGQTGIFVTDVARAWRLAEDMYEENSSYSISLQCFYALMIASLNSLAANLPNNLLIALVNKEVWTPNQGLAHTLQSSNPSQKADSLTKLAKHLPPNLKKLALEKALTAAKQIQDKRSRATALSALAGKLPPELLPEALAAAKQFQDDKSRDMALRALADRLPPELLPEVLTAAKQFQDEESRAEALSALAGKLQPESLPEALTAAKQIQDEWSRAEALSALAGKLPPELLPEALTAAKLIQDERSRATALSALADKLPELLPEALAAVKLIQNGSRRAEALSALAGKLPPKLLPEALAAAKLIEHEISRIRPLSALIYKLPPKLLPEALAAAKQFQNEDYCSKVLSALIYKLPAELLPEALATAKQFLNEWNRVLVLSKLPPELLPEALAAAKLIQGEWNRVTLLRALADKLPELLPEALTAAKQIQHEQSRAHALNLLANKLSPELLPEVLAAAKHIHDENSRTKVLSTLADKLSPELLPEALAAAKHILDEYYRAKALNALADKLPELLPEALAAAKLIHNEYDRAKALSALVGKLPPELLPEVLAATKQIQDESSRVTLLSALADKLPELLPEALAVTKQIQDERSRSSALIALADKLPPELLPEALAVTKQIRDERSCNWALRALADKLPPELLPEAVSVAQQIQERWIRTEALGALVVKLPELLLEALTTAKQIQDEFNRDMALIGLVDKLPQELLPVVLTVTEQFQDERNCAIVQNALADKLPPELLPEALTAAKQIHDEFYRSKILIALVDKLPPELLPVVQAAAKQIQNENYRVEALAALADKLPESLPEALAAAKQIPDGHRRASALRVLADKLPPELLPEGLAAIKQIQKGGINEHLLADSLRALADKLPQELLPEALATAKQFQYKDYRATVLGALVIPLSKMPTTLLFSCWKQTLYELSLRTRQNLLTDIEKLVPVIFALGSHAAIASVNDAIQKVGRWWH